MPKTTLIAIGAGIVSAMLYLSLIIGSPGALILAYLSSLPLFIAGLSMGLSPLLIAAVTGIIITGLGDEILSAIMYGGLTAGPVILLVRLSLISRTKDGIVEWYPAGRLVSWLAGIAGGYFVCAVTAFSMIEGGLRGQVEKFLTAILEKLSNKPWPELDGANTVIQVWEPLFPAMVGVSWIIMVSLNGILAQGLVVRFSQNIRPSPATANLQLPRQLIFLFGLSLALSLLPSTFGYVGTTLSVYIMVPYLLLGLAVVHALVGRLSASQFALVLFYIVLVMLGLFGLALVAGLGLIEQWFNLRRRFGVVFKGEEE